MPTKLATAAKQRSRSARRPPWWTDVKAAREAAFRAGRPCVLILHADQSAL
jgi:hypothetical protein